MKKLSRKTVEIRINRAVVGFRIPIMEIVKLSKELDAAIVAGKSDDELKTIVAAFPGVVATS
jgi:hypothetical protein